MPAVFMVRHGLEDPATRISTVRYGRGALPVWTEQTFGWRLQTVRGP
ncbi:MAG: hypothetical protein SFV23_15310 [Planctomycetaceae bacterium]|nr:hypothetical protein [Planctomycetaceae bacterium]